MRDDGQSPVRHRPALAVERGTPLHRETRPRVDIEEGQHAAKLCALNVIAELRAALDGDLDRVLRCSASADSSTRCRLRRTAQVINGASDTFVDVFGDLGRHLEWPSAWLPCRTTLQWKSKAC